MKPCPVNQYFMVYRTGLMDACLDWVPQKGAEVKSLGFIPSFVIRSGNARCRR
jgi:hypothetical protein